MNANLVEQKNRLHEKKYQLPRDFLGTPTWPPFYNCFGTAVMSCEDPHIAIGHHYLTLFGRIEFCL